MLYQPQYQLQHHQIPHIPITNVIPPQIPTISNMMQNMMQNKKKSNVISLPTLNDDIEDAE